jgi:hypothetical protein
LKDGSVVKLNNVERTIASKGGGATNVTCQNAYGVSLTLTAGDLSALGNAQNLIEKVRIYTTDGYVDIEVKQKTAKSVPELYKIFIDEVTGVTDSSKSLKKEKRNW